LPIKSNHFNRKRPSWNKSKEGFNGYKKGYDPEQKKFRSDPPVYQVNEKAISMLKEDKISGHRLSSGMKAHKVATDKLRDLEFDPIEALLMQLDEIDDLLTKEMNSNAPRAMVLSNLINAKTKILETLLPYRYGKAPTITVEDSDQREPIKILLSLDGDTKNEEAS